MGVWDTGVQERSVGLYVPVVQTHSGDGRRRTTGTRESRLASRSAWCLSYRSVPVRVLVGTGSLRGGPEEIDSSVLRPTSYPGVVRLTVAGDRVGRVDPVETTKSFDLGFNDWSHCPGNSREKKNSGDWSDLTSPY